MRSSEMKKLSLWGNSKRLHNPSPDVFAITAHQRAVDKAAGTYFDTNGPYVREPRCDAVTYPAQRT